MTVLSVEGGGGGNLVHTCPNLGRFPTGNLDQGDVPPPTRRLDSGAQDEVLAATDRNNH